MNYFVSNKFKAVWWLWCIHRSYVDVKGIWSW